MSDPRLHIVSGKGGVGKSLIAAGIASSFAARGDKTILISYDESGLPHPVYGTAMSYEPVEVRKNLDLSCVDAEQAIHEYVKVNTVLPALYQPVLNNPAVQRFLRALPVFDELITLGKIYELTTNSKSPYVHVVVDGPSTGHCKVILQVAAVAASTLAAGPVYTNSLKIRDTLKNPELSELIIATLPESTPVREALELYDFTRETGLIDCKRIIVNRYIESRFQTDELQQLQSLGEHCSAAAPLWETVELQENVAREHAANIEALEVADATLYCLPELDSSRASTRFNRMTRLVGEVMSNG